MKTKGKLLGVTIGGKYYPANTEASITTQDLVKKLTIEVKNGKANFDAFFDNQPIKIVMSTKMPDGIYDQDGITFEISDGVRDPDFPVGCYVLHTKEYAKKHNIPVFI